MKWKLFDRHEIIFINGSVNIKTPKGNHKTMINIGESIQNDISSFSTSKHIYYEKIDKVYDLNVWSDLVNNISGK